MKILIVGAGIAGLSLAAHLQKQNHEITIIEKDTTWDKKGYAIILHYNGFKTLKGLPNSNSLLKESHLFTKTSIQDFNGNILKEVDYEKLLSKYGPSILILREKLHKYLLTQSKNFKIKMGVTIKVMQESTDCVTVSFSDNTQASFDVVVGADGVASKVRELTFSKNARKFLGVEYWTAIIPSIDGYTITFPQLILHNNKSFIIYPFDNSQRLCLTFGISVSKDIRSHISSVEDLQNNFSEFKYFTPKLLAMLPQYKTMYHGFISEVMLPTWHTQRIVLIGDAAHAMNPINGMGTSMVLEDSYVLAEELSKVDNKTVVVALKQYERRRKKRVVKLQKDASYLAFLIKIGNQFTNIPRNMYIRLLPTFRFINRLEKLFVYQM